MEPKVTLNMVRSQSELAEQFKTAQNRDPLGFEANEYADFIDWEHIQPFVKPGSVMTQEKWEAETASLDDLDKRAKSYLEFWLEKIEGERGISVGRATQHYTAWKWLLGHPDWATFPGSCDNEDDAGWYQRDAYNYIKAQVDSGDWDKLTSEAQKGIANG